MHIKQVFIIESVRIGIVAGCRDKDLRIRCPAHSLISLGAVCGNIDKVALLAPENIGDQLVDLLNAGREGTRIREIGVAGNAGEIIGFKTGSAFYFRVAVSVEGEHRLQDMLVSIGDIPVLGKSGAKVVTVEIALLKDLADLDVDRRAGRLMEAKAEGTCLVLAEVKDLLAGRRVDQRGRCQELLASDRNGQALCQGKGVLQSLYAAKGSGRDRSDSGESIVSLFTVIDVGECDVAAVHSPGIIRSDDLAGAVLIVNAQLGDQLPGVAVIGGPAGLGVETKAPLVPAVSEDDRDLIVRSADASSGGIFAAFTALAKGEDLLSHIVGLILDPCVIVVAVRSQELIPDHFSRDPGPVESETADIKAGAADLPGGIEIHFFMEDRVAGLAVIAADPLCLPGLVHFSRLKILKIADGLLALDITPYADVPVIAGAGLELQIDIVGEGTDPCVFTGIVEDFLLLLVRIDHDLGSCLLFSLRLFDSVGEGDMGELIPDRVE